MEENKKQSYACRVCLKNKCIEVTSLVENQVLLNLFEFCVDVIVDLSISPQTLCKHCAREIKNYAEFKEKCQASEEFLRSNKELVCCQSIKVEPLSELKTETDEDGDPNNLLFSNTLEPNERHSEATLNIVKEDDVLISKKSINLDDLTIYKKKNHTINSTKEPNKKTKTKKRIKSKIYLNLYQCTFCKREYRKQKWLNNHIKICCMNKSRIQQQVEIKREDLKEKELEYHCGLCQLSFAEDQRRLKDHLNEHLSNNDLKCKLCDFTGRDFADMITHRYTHYPNMSATCHICGKRMIAVKSLQFHFRSVHLHKAGGMCSFCNKVFTTCKTWKRHERLHTDKRVFICDLCGRKFLYKYQIEAHLIDHSDVRHFVCETCGKAFKRMSALKGHIENIHEPSTPIVCEHCNRTYKNKEKLRLHLKKLTADKPFECSVCSKKYGVESELKSHMFWHTDERPHVCEICGSKYKAKGQLKVHMRNHTGERPHKCGICGKGFGTTSQMKRHKSVHTGVRAHRCLYCRRSFHGLKTLLEHSLQHKTTEIDGKSES